MPKVALTDRFVAGVKQTTGQRDYFDAHVRGLVLRVADSGLKTWCAFYTSPKKTASEQGQRSGDIPNSGLRMHAAELLRHERTSSRALTRGMCTTAR